VPSPEEDGRKGEKIFADLCDDWQCEYLHIAQGKDQLSSEMFRNYEKRPDFLVNIPNIAPIFVEVKVRSIGPLRKVGNFAGHLAFNENTDSFMRIQNFEENMRMSTWYAFIEKINGTINETVAYMCPVSRMEKMIPHGARDDPSTKWPNLWTPKECMNKCGESLELHDMCLKCRDRVCEKLDWGFLSNSPYPSVYESSK
jgi:hypothetical protein